MVFEPGSSIMTTKKVLMMKVSAAGERVFELRTYTASAGRPASGRCGYDDLRVFRCRR
jgi:hypothetical protein